MKKNYIYIFLLSSYFSGMLVGMDGETFFEGEDSYSRAESAVRALQKSASAESFALFDMTEKDEANLLIQKARSEETLFKKVVKIKEHKREET